MGEKGYKEILKELEGEVLTGPLIFYGEEDFLIKWAIEKIVERYIGRDMESLNLTAIDWENAEIKDLIPLWETLPMMAEKRLIVIENFVSGGRSEEADNKEKELLEEIENIPEDSLLILTGTAVDKRRKIYKTVEAKGSAYHFGRLNESGLRSFINKRFRQAGKMADNSVLRVMMEESGYFDRQSNYSLYNMENDIKKLIALSDGDRITLDQVRAGLTKNTEAFVFDMIDAISTDNKSEAIYLLHSLLSAGEAWQRLLPLISSAYELMLIGKEMGEEGHSQREIVSFTGAHEYRIKKAVGLSRKYTIKQLRNILSACLKVDGEIKSGLLEPELALELLIANI